MKKAIIVAAGIMLLTACNQTKDSTSNSSNDGKGMNDNMSKYEANIKEIYRAIETGDMSKLDSFITKDVVDHDANMGKDVVGLDSVKAHLSQVHNYIDNLKMEPVRSAATPDGEYYFTQVHMTGKWKANPWGMMVGQDIDDMGIDMVKVKDQKATDHWGFTSDKDMHEQMMDMMKGSKMQGNKQMMAKDSMHHQ